jgi:muramoyltetrapeptide carboxypeptidase
LPQPPRPRIHITAVGSSAANEIHLLSPNGVKGMLALAQRGAGDRYEVTTSPKMLLAKEIDEKGGRSDDAARIREVQSLLADDRVAALVTLRGGAWFTRLLDRINFNVLKDRRRPIVLFGFSEMTTLIAIAGQYPQAVGLYDLGPGFLYGGPRWYARKHVKELARHVKLPDNQHEGFAIGWALAQYPDRFTEFFRDVAAILDGQGSSRRPEGHLLAGKLPSQSRIVITGGNLSVMLPLIGSRYASAIDTRGKWLALEDVNEAADPMDRMMAALKLNGLFERAEGIILGDFHDKDTDLRDAAFQMLKYHLPTKRQIPVIRLDNFGHIWPLAPLPMHREVTLRCERSKGRGQPRVWLDIPWAEWVRR